jgi:hypothetical protein
MQDPCLSTWQAGRRKAGRRIRPQAPSRRMLSIYGMLALLPAPRQTISTPAQVAANGRALPRDARPARTCGHWSMSCTPRQGSRLRNWRRSGREAPLRSWLSFAITTFLAAPPPRNGWVTKFRGPRSRRDFPVRGWRPPSKALDGLARLGTAKTQLAAAENELRQAVVAEHAASHTSAWALSVQARVTVRTVRTVRRWLEADGAGGDGPTEPPRLS